MQALGKHKFLLIILGVLIVFGGYMLTKDSTNGVSTDETQETETGQETGTSDAMNEAEATGVNYSSDIDLSGIHIMTNGDVMAGDGTVIRDARIRDDGMIEFPDGTTAEPAFDMRP